MTSGRLDESTLRAIEAVAKAYPKPGDYTLDLVAEIRRLSEGPQMQTKPKGIGPAARERGEAARMHGWREKPEQRTVPLDSPNDGMIGPGACANEWRDEAKARGPIDWGKMGERLWEAEQQAEDSLDDECSVDGCAESSIKGAKCGRHSGVIVDDEPEQQDEQEQKMSPEDICLCGHSRFEHDDYGNGPCERCGCAFVRVVDESLGSALAQARCERDEAQRKAQEQRGRAGRAEKELANQLGRACRAEECAEQAEARAERAVEALDTADAQRDNARQEAEHFRELADRHKEECGELREWCRIARQERDRLKAKVERACERARCYTSSMAAAEVLGILADDQDQAPDEGESEHDRGKREEREAVIRYLRLSSRKGERIEFLSGNQAAYHIERGEHRKDESEEQEE